MGLIKKPNELTVKNALSALIYGQPGMGKTTLALSSPQPLLLDFDGGVHRVNAAQTPYKFPNGKRWMKFLRAEKLPNTRPSLLIRQEKCYPSWINI